MENTSQGPTNLDSGSSRSNEGLLTQATSSAHAKVDSLAGAAEDAARKAQPAIDQVAAMAHKAVDKASDAAVPTAEWLAKQGENLHAAQEKLVADTSAYISANPFKSIGIAVLAGFLLNRMLR